MKRKVLILLAIITSMSTFTGCKSKTDTKLEDKVIEEGVYDISDEVAAATKEIVYSDEEIVLQNMGNWRTSVEGFEKAKAIGLIPSDVEPNQAVNKEQLIESFSKFGEVLLNIDTSNLDSSLESLLKVKDIIPYLTQILNSYKEAGKEDVFDVNLFKETFKVQNNNMDKYDDGLIEQLSLLRFFDALPINQDDVMILDNTLTFNILGNSLLRLADLRVEQLISVNFPEECQECGTHVDEWYPLLSKIDKSQTINIKLDNAYKIKYAEASILNQDTISGEEFEEDGLQ